MNFPISRSNYFRAALKTAVSIFLAVFIVACGGGASSGSSSNTPGLQLSLVDGTGAAVTNVVVGNSYTLVTTVSQSGGVAANVIVTFAAGGGATASPTTALTNASGVASVSFTPTTIGAYAASANASVTQTTVTAATATTTSTTTTSTVTVTGAVNYSVSAAPIGIITLGSLSATSSALVSGGNTAVGTYVYNNGAIAATTPTAVSFTVSCGQVIPNIATSDGNGHVSTNYLAVDNLGNLCSGSVTVNAFAANVSKQATITVASPTTGSINFVSASPSQIFLNSAGASSQSTLTFKVLGPTGLALPNWPIDFTLLTNPGGVTFATQGNTALVTISSDSTGAVAIPVFAGGTPGAVTMQAAWHSNPQIFSTSNNFTIASGPPSQLHMSLSATFLVIEGFNYDGATTQITARIADANGNPVPDGTVINFVSDGGQINRSCSTTTANAGGLNAGGFSECSVTLMSQNPRGYNNNGRVAVLAYLEGTNSVINGVQQDQGFAYRDDNENQKWDSGEFVITKSGTTNVCLGSGMPYPAQTNTCLGQLATTVRGQIMIMFASNAPVVTPTLGQGGNFNTPASATYSFTLHGDDGNGQSSLLPMPAGTTISVQALKLGCSASTVTPSSFPSTTPGTPSVSGGGATVIYPDFGALVTVVLTGTPAVAATSTSSAVPAVSCTGSSLIITTTSPARVSGSTTVTVP